jgi:hypothetical protein
MQIGFFRCSAEGQKSRIPENSGAAAPGKFAIESYPNQKGAGGGGSTGMKKSDFVFLLWVLTFGCF